MISRLQPKNIDILSLTTIATPHRGSAFADYMFDQIGPKHVPRVYRTLESVGFQTGAFGQLTRAYMRDEFNPRTPDQLGVRYYSYGASLDPTLWSVFKFSHDVISRLEESENDGLVSVESSRWGEYKGTLVGVSHLDLINWTNRIKSLVWRSMGWEVNFNALALYLDIAGKSIPSSIEGLRKC
ncbi:hypothetical protein BDY21DRAFT_355978 [Lineolata rhizophorae]|uniref:Alpha/Beta hydrolase protein n=1 Tax=Lineolata rhizophorae TaxID=578093 RepID=A0A6A6NP61_9PEZI|nr:hypothetical protein BDY21DRAFT_355978 [Lineolata rhizophorae]